MSDFGSEMGADLEHRTPLGVIAIILGVLVLSEHISIVVIAGIALILCGIALTRTRVTSAAA